MRVLFLTLMTMSFFSSCGQHTFDEMLGDLLSFSVPVVRSKEVKNQKVLYVDAREKEEFEVSHIPGAMHSGYDQFDAGLFKSVQKDTPIVVYCSVGYRSEKIAEKLIALGFTDVRNLYGGIFLWKDSGFEVVNNSGITQDVHTYSEKWSKWLKTGNKKW